MSIIVHDSQLPTTVTQLAGHGISSVVGGLTPPMLGVLLLILAGLAASTYFLNILIQGQQNHLKSLIDLQERSITRVLVTHDREFDALMKMIAEAQKSLSLPPPPPQEQEDVLPLPTPRP